MADLPLPSSPRASADPSALAADAFIQRWTDAALSERANYVLFLTELCDVLGVPRPEPATADHSQNAYVFERAVPLHDENTGQTTTGFIDLYRRGCFILEAKQYDAATPEPTPAFAAAEAAQRKSGVRRDTAAWDRKMLEARAQAERYLRHLPPDEPVPVFLLVVDVGHSIELFADFSQKGRAPLHFPDPRTYRLRLTDLAKPSVRALLRAVWTDPASLDPSKRAAAVTREVAAHLAELARLFEKKHSPATVASFLSRCLFCMFAEDVALLPRGGFTGLLDSVKDDPGSAVPLLQKLFEEMNAGGYSVILRKTLLHFNGGLFSEATALPLDAAQLSLLRCSAALEWRHVEPAIFGTLLERALDPAERHKLGAHYTPRAYVERLVLPTVIEPLREEWQNVRAAAVTLATRGDLKGAIKEARAFHHRLCALRVLDPACGSGNFLYVTLEHLKRLEGEVLELIESFGENMRLDLAGETVDPHQFLGIEINPRAATVAELVLWIGYLQWHHRNRGETEWPEPVLRAFKNIECRDAVLAWDAKGFLTTEGEFCPLDQAKQGTTLRYVWDRRTMKTDSVTGRKVPDESGVILIDAYVKPRPAPWPEADFIIGNPPFLGKGKIREDLGDGYVETLRAAYSNVPESADFVMYWWHKAAEECLACRTRRFGFITTNSIRQTFNRRVVKRALELGVSLRFAIPDHPWVDTADGAAVRIAMTVGALDYTLPEKGSVAEPPPDPSRLPGELQVVSKEVANADEISVEILCLRGRIGSGLNIGADLEDVVELESNSLIANNGVMLGSRGFIVEASDAIQGSPSVLRPIINGNDILQRSRHARVIDFFGLNPDQARSAAPACYERVLTTVKPERDSNRRASRRNNWWLFGEVMPKMRKSLELLNRYIVTAETAKHRIFSFLEARVVPEHPLIAIALPDAFHLGILSSRTHIIFALAAGGTLEDRPRYNKSRCFDPFPFPECSEAQKARIRDLAEALDAHRKRAQADHGLGLTDIYNVLEKVRAGESLPAKDKAVHDAALVSTLKQLHDDLDSAVADAYGWPWPLADADILARVVALNTHRAAEEASGLIRWLRTDYQKTDDGGQGTRRPAGGQQDALALTNAAGVTAANRKARKAPWAKTLPERTKAVDTALSTEAKPVTAAALAARFARAKEADVAEILETLAALGRARRTGDGGHWLR